MAHIDKYYKILGVDINADLDQVKKAYRQLAKKYHPDYAEQSPQQQREAEAKFQEITNAYDHIKANLENNGSIETEIFIDSTKESKADLFYRLGALEAEDEHWQEAIFYFTKAIKINPDFLNAYYYRAAVLEKQGFEIRARADLATAENIKYRKENISFVDENIETVKENNYSVKENIETVKENNYSVKENIETVKENNYSVKENIETVKENNYSVQENIETMEENNYSVQENIEIVEENNSFMGNYEDNMVVRKGRKYQRPSPLPRQYRVNNYNNPISKKNTSLYQWQILIPVMLILSFAFAVARLGNDSQNNNRNSSQIDNLALNFFIN
ncbi:MAG: DnaJ domain-containing protein [Cyanobacterium sp. T60_A2020_053]|nr:DnaJ domain-containing protein [Cyanobacterium sp. T60_A2020_053]